MNPIIRVINYLFDKNGIENKEKTVNAFFDNGISFPQLIQIAFENDKKFNFNPTPETNAERDENNSKAFNYLLLKNKVIKEIFPKYKDFNDINKIDKVNLLSLILTKQFYKINYREIIQKCNFLFRDLDPKIHYDQKKDFVCQKCILELLNILSKQPINSEKTDFDQIMEESFGKAGAPLVIDKTSLSPQNYFMFFIQIEILFNHFEVSFKDYYEAKKVIKSEKHSKNSSDPKKEIISSDSDTFLYKNTNGLFRFTSSLKNSTYSLTYKKDQNVLSNKKSLKLTKKEQFDLDTLIKTLNIICQSNKEISFNCADDITNTEFLLEAAKLICGFEIDTIKDLTDELIEKEPNFEFLIFDFQKSKYILSSSILLYTNILNFFFLKKSKQDFLRMTTIILFKDYDYEKYDKFEILLKWDTYDKLFQFVTKHINAETNITGNEIPRIIDDNFLKFFSDKYEENQLEELPNAIYYQLQFISSYIELCPLYSFIEKILINLKMIRNIKVPSYEDIVFQVQRRRQINQQLKINNDITNDVDLFDNSSNLIPSDNEDASINTSVRLSIEKINQIQQDYTMKEKPIKIEIKYLFNKGILHRKINQDIQPNQEKWNVEIRSILKNKITEENPQNLNFDLISNKSERGKLFKIFEYDEIKTKWIFNSKVLDEFIEAKSICAKTPLFFLLNSCEDDAISIASKFVKTLFPKLDDNGIYVYGLCDKDISELSYTKLEVSSNFNSVKPIFLLLHVPPGKENLPNISQILIQIWTFLLNICDFQIVVLNRENYDEQIELAKNMLEMISPLNKTTQNHSNNNNFTPEMQDDDYESDDLDGYSDFESDSEEQSSNVINDNYDNILNHCNSPKFIFLVNDPRIEFKSQTKSQTKSLFITNLENQIENVSLKEFCYINMNVPFTYYSFLWSIYTRCSGCQYECFQFNDLFKKVEQYKLSSEYISLRCRSDWKKQFKQFVKQKFSQGKSSSIIADIKNELLNIVPTLDQRPVFHNKFFQEFNAIVSDIKKERSQMFNESIFKEMEIKSKDNLSLLEKTINKKHYWPEEDKEGLIESHINFLRNEYFSIITLICQNESYDIQSLYEANIEVLKERIEKDTKTINNLKFKKYNMKMSLKTNKVKKVEKGTDYKIREYQAVRELEMMISPNQKLEDKDGIEQDF